MKNLNTARPKSHSTSKLRAGWRILLAFVVAVAVTYVAAAILVSQWNLASLEAFGLTVTMVQRWQAATHDVGHMYEIYLPLIAIGFVLALPVAWLLSAKVFSRAGSLRNAMTAAAMLYPLAGFVALITIHVALKLAFDVSAVAPTRTIGGLLGQALAGALGGYMFYRMTRVASTDG